MEFRTAIEIGRQGLARYERQVGFYVEALARATGRPAEGVMVRV